MENKEQELLKVKNLKSYELAWKYKLSYKEMEETKLLLRDEILEIFFFFKLRRIEIYRV